MVTACSDHVAGGAVRWASYHFADKVHLPGRDHIADAGDGVEHIANFDVVEVLFADSSHRNLENAAYASVEKHLEFVEVRFP